MTVQTSYAENMSAAYEGQLADLNNKYSDIVSKRVETSAGIAPGRVVSPGTADDQVVIGGDATGIGVTIRDLSKRGAASTNELTYAQYEVAGVMKKGYLYVNIPTASAMGTGLFYNDTTGVIDAGTASTGETQLTGCTLEETTTAENTIAKIRLDL